VDFFIQKFDPNRGNDREEGAAYQEATKMITNLMRGVAQLILEYVLLQFNNHFN